MAPVSSECSTPLQAEQFSPKSEENDNALEPLEDSSIDHKGCDEETSKEATESVTETQKHPQSRVLKTCFICNRDFTRGTNLRRHLAIIHRLNPHSLLSTVQHNGSFNEDPTTAASSDSTVKQDSDGESNLAPVQKSDDNLLSDSKKDENHLASYDSLPSMALCDMEEQESGDVDTPALNGTTSKQSLRLKLPKRIKMCPYCGKTFTRNTNLRRHMENDVCRGGLITWETKGYRHQLSIPTLNTEEDEQSMFDSNAETSPRALGKTMKIEDDESSMMYESSPSLAAPLAVPTSEFVSSNLSPCFTTPISTAHGHWAVSDTMNSGVDMTNSQSFALSPADPNEDIHTVIPSDYSDQALVDKGDSSEFENNSLFNGVLSSDSNNQFLQHSKLYPSAGSVFKSGLMNSNSWRQQTMEAVHHMSEENMAEDDSMSDENDDGEPEIPVVLPSDYISPEYEANFPDDSNELLSGENAELTPDNIEHLTMEEVAAFQQIAGDTSQTDWKLLSCNICRKQFSNVHVLLKHLMIHRTTEKESFLQAAQQKEIEASKENSDVNFAESDRRIPTLTISSTDRTMQINCGGPADGRRRPLLSRTCHICNKVFSRTTTLRRHMVVHQKTYKCNKCSRNLRKDKFLAHLAWCGQLPSPDSESKNILSPGSHDSGASPSPSFTHNTSLDSSGQEEERSSCDETPSFSGNVICTKGGCRRHKLTRTCHICHKVFSRTTTLRRHMTIHNRKVMLACHKCSLAFPEGPELLKHVEQCEGGEKLENGHSNRMTKSSQAKENDESFRDDILGFDAGRDQNLAEQKLGNDSMITNSETDKPALDNHVYSVSFSKDEQENFKSLGGIGSPDNSHSGERSASPNHINKFWLSCHVCGKFFLRAETLQEHMLLHKTQDRVYNCVTCGRNFYTENEYAEHAANCYGRLVSSNIQNTLMRRNQSLKRRIQHIPQRVPVPQVPKAPRTPTSDSDSVLELHSVSKDQIESSSLNKLHKVSSNPKKPSGAANSEIKDQTVLKSLPAQNSTSSAHRGRPKMSRTCQVCKKTFSRTTVLRIHMQLHQDRPVYSCDHCKRSFHGEAKYNHHLPLCSSLMLFDGDAGKEPAANDNDLSVSGTQQGEANNTDAGGDMKKSGRPRLTRTCHICHKTFSRTTVLRKHMSIHDNDPKYKCSECGSTFNKKTLYIVHINSCKKVNKEENIDNGTETSPPEISVNGSELPSMAMDIDSAFAVGSDSKMSESVDQNSESECDMVGFSVRDISLDDGEVKSKPIQSSASEIDGGEGDPTPTPPEDATPAPAPASIESVYYNEKAKKGCGRPKMSRTCPICHKTFSRTTVLRKHMSVHEEKPLHECGACGSAFRRKNHLTAHMLKCMEAMKLQHERDALNDVPPTHGDTSPNVEIATSLTQSSNVAAPPASQDETSEIEHSSEKEVSDSMKQAVLDDHVLHQPSPSTFPIEYLESIGGITMSMDHHFKSDDMDYTSDNDAMYSLSSSNDLMRQLQDISSTRHSCYKCYASFDQAQELEEHILVCTDEVLVMSPPSLDDLHGHDKSFKEFAADSKDGIDVKGRRNPLRNIGC